MIPLKPTHISAHCPKCKALLVLADEEASVRVSSGERFLDEWVCALCLDEVYLDWPESKALKATSLLN